MVAFAAVGAFIVLLRLSGTLQKHVFEPLVSRDLRKALKKARPHADSRQRLMIDAVTRSWDTAVGWAYDDPVELISDLGAMGVKLSLLRAGVALPARLGLAGGTKGAVQAVETFLKGIQGLTGADPQAAATDIAKGLDGFMEKMIPDVVTPELIDSGTKVALDIATLAGEAGAFASKAASGDVMGSLVSGGNLLKAGLDVLGSFLGFVSQAQKELPEPPPPGRAIMPHEFRRFEEALREKPVSLPKEAPPPPPPPPAAPAVARVQEDYQGFKVGDFQQLLREDPELFRRVDTPTELQTSLMVNGSVLAGGSLRALKAQRTATTFPFG